MCKIIVSETLFDRKGYARKTITHDLGEGVHVTYVCEHGDVECDIRGLISLVFGKKSLFEQYSECNDYCLSNHGRARNPGLLGIEKAYVTLESGETVLVTLSRVQYNEKLIPKFYWQVFFE